MKMFSLYPDIHKFDSFKECAEFFTIGKDDFILTHEVLYDDYMKNLNLPCDYIFQEKYGAEPSDRMIDRIMSDQKRKDYKRVIAVGGGSVIDIAKILVLKDVGATLDVFERKIPITRCRELIVVPTTCGTGSEVTNVAIALIESKNTKLGLAVDEIFPDHAVLIPRMAEKLPFKFFAFSSVDALIHAMESYLSPRANRYTEIFSVNAVEMIIDGYKAVIKNGENYRTVLIEQFLVASNFAGIAFGNAGVGAVHALSYPVGGKYHVPHGEVNYQFFTEIFKAYNRLRPDGKIKTLNSVLSALLGLKKGGDVYAELDSFLGKILPRNRLSGYGMTQEEITGFTDIVIEKQQRLLANNYVPLSRDEISGIYRNLW